MKCEVIDLALSPLLFWELMMSGLDFISILVFAVVAFLVLCIGMFTLLTTHFWFSVISIFLMGFSGLWIGLRVLGIVHVGP